MAHKNQLFANMSNLDSGALQTEIMHPLFIATGNLFDVTAQEAKQGLLLVSFIALELLGSLFFAVGIMFSEGNGQSRPAYGHTQAPATGYVPQSNSKPPLSRQPKRAVSEMPQGGMSKLTQPKADMSEMTQGDMSKLTQPNESKSTRKKAKRASLSADTGVEGDLSKRYEIIEKAVKGGSLKPTLNAITTFKIEGVGIGRPTAKKYQAELLKHGIIKPKTLNNGRTSYQLV